MVGETTTAVDYHRESLRWYNSPLVESASVVAGNHYSGSCGGRYHYRRHTTAEGDSPASASKLPCRHRQYLSVYIRIKQE